MWVLRHDDPKSLLNSRLKCGVLEAFKIVQIVRILQEVCGLKKFEDVKKKILNWGDFPNFEKTNIDLQYLTNFVSQRRKETTDETTEKIYESAEIIFPDLGYGSEFKSIFAFKLLRLKDTFLFLSEGINEETTTDDAIKTMNYITHKRLEELVKIVSSYTCTFLNDEHRGVLIKINKEEIAKDTWLPGDYQCVDGIYYCNFCETKITSENYQTDLSIDNKKYKCGANEILRILTIMEILKEVHGFERFREIKKKILEWSVYSSFEKTSHELNYLNYFCSQRKGETDEDKTQKLTYENGEKIFLELIDKTFFKTVFTLNFLKLRDVFLFLSQGINGETTIEDAIKFINQLPETVTIELTKIVSQFVCAFLNDKHEGLVQGFDKEQIAKDTWLPGDYQCIDGIYYCDFCDTKDVTKIIEERDKINFNGCWL